MEELKNWLCKKMIALRLLLILLCIIITGICVWNCSKIKIFDDPLKWPPKFAHNVKVNNAIQDLFGGANVVTIQLTVKEGDIFDPKVLAKVKRISDKILLMDGVVPSYLTSLSAQKVKYMKGEKDLLTVEPLMETIPETKAEIERLKYGVFHNPLLYGPIVSIDKKSVIIITDFRTGDRKANEATYFRTTPIEIYKGIKKIIEPENDNNLTVKCAGSPIIIGWVNSEGIPYVFVTFCCFLLVMGIVLYLIFRNWQGVCIPLIVGIISILWGFGFYVLICGPIFGSASCLLAPFLIMASATCHSVQFLKRFEDEEYPKAQETTIAISNTFRGLFNPMVVALLTDIMSFVILAIVPFENVSLLGGIGGLGLTSLVFIICIFLIPFLACFPAIRHVHHETKVQRRQNAFTRFENIGSWVIGNGRIILGISLILAIVCVPFLFRMDVGQDNTYAIHNYLTKSWENNPIYQMEMNIKEKFKGVFTCNLMIDTKKQDGMKTIAVLKAMDAFSIDLQKRCPEIAGFLHLPLYIKLMNRFMNEENEEYFTIPDDPKAISDYVLMYTMGELGAFDSIMDAPFQRAPIYIFVDSTSHQTVKKVLGAIQKLVPKYFGGLEVDVHYAGGNLGIAGAFNVATKEWLIYSTVISLFIAGVIITLIFRSLLWGALLLLSPIFAIIYTLALLYLLGVEINSNISTVAAIGVGIGVDAGCYLLFRLIEEFKTLGDFQKAMLRAFSTAGKANIESYLPLVIGCWSVIPVPLYLGYTGFGVGLVLLINLIFTMGPLVAVFMVLKPKIS